MDRQERLGSVFDSDEEDSTRDWTKVDCGIRNDGLRQGLDTGKEEILQLGFNSAFREAIKMAVAGGKLQGNICAHLSLPNQSATETQGGYSLSQSQNKPSNDLLQNLLTSNTNLLASIPHLLTAVPGRNMSSSLECPELANLVSSSIPEQNNAQNVVLVNEFPVATASEISSPCTGTVSSSKDEGEVKGKETVSCEDICSNKEYFWHQLNNFQSQAQTLGVAPLAD